MNEAAVEHETAKMLIEQLENMEPDDPNYVATFTVLGEYVMHHVKEEEDEMFPQAKKKGEGARSRGPGRGDAHPEGRAHRRNGPGLGLKPAPSRASSVTGTTSVKVLPSPSLLCSSSSAAEEPRQLAADRQA